MHQEGRPPPLVALRTYRYLRLGALGMLLLLAISITWHNLMGENQVLDSISAYYYTSVQSILVGTLVTLGFVMFVLWGRTTTEDALFNLAGMLAPLVAFVPVRDLSRCDLLAPAGQDLHVEARPTTLDEACKAAVVNNVGAYFIVLGLLLVLLTGLGAYGRRQDRPWPWVSTRPRGYWTSLLAAWTLFVIGAGTYVFFERVFYAVAHFTSASLMFALIIAAIVVIAHDKRHNAAASRVGPDLPWDRIYLGIALTMSVGAALLGGGVALWSHIAGRESYWILAVEIWLLSWLAIFWAFQTWDRWNDGAPHSPAAAPPSRDLADPADPSHAPAPRNL